VRLLDLAATSFNLLLDFYEIGHLCRSTGPFELVGGKRSRRDITHDPLPALSPQLAVPSEQLPTALSPFELLHMTRVVWLTHWPPETDTLTLRLPHVIPDAAARADSIEPSQRKTGIETAHSAKRVMAFLLSCS